ncbi:MAG: MFS transporter [Actinomycetota bacterium]|nr:MFS transporter [Actinomycetota bacterium]
MTNPFRSLRNANYRLFAAGMLVSNVGVWMQRVAQDWLVYELTGSGVALGITTGLQFLPMLFLAPWGGVIADRYPKLRVLTATQAFLGVVAAVLGVLTVTGVVRVEHVYLLALLLGCGSAIDNPARQSFAVELVGRDDLQNAVALNSASFNAARFVGPAAAGLLIELVGTGPVFLLNGLSYVAVLLALQRMDRRALQPAPPVGRGPGQLRAGLRYVTGRPDLVFVLVVVFFVGTFGLNFQLTMALMASQVYGKGAGEYGLLGSILAIGSLTASLLAAGRGRPRLRLVAGGALAFGAVEIAAGLMPTYETFAASLVLVGLCSLTFLTAANATLQLSVDPAMRGRVMALYLTVFFGGTPLGAPLVGWIAEAFGPRWSLLFGGIVSVAATLVAVAVLLRGERGRRTADARAVPAPPLAGTPQQA